MPLQTQKHMDAMRAMSAQHQQRQQELLQRIAKLASPEPSLITAEGVQQMLQESCNRQQALSTAEAIRAKVGEAT